MGEIAEMMLDGTLCECCGEYIHDDEASGFPRYCSQSCAADRGMEFFGDDDEDEDDTFEGLKTEIEINISMLKDNADDLKKFNSKKSRALKGLVKNLNAFLASLKE